MDKSKIKFDMNFCRRCGAKFVQNDGHIFTCEQGHIIYANASPTAGVVLLNNKQEMLVLVRSIEPGKGRYDVPGGFCNGIESPEESLVRELEEEVGFTRDDYGPLTYILSGNEGYDYHGEVLPNCCCMFWAKVTSDKQPVPADDASDAMWLPLKTIDLDRIYFPVVRAGIERMISRLP